MHIYSTLIFKMAALGKCFWMEEVLNIKGKQKRDAEFC